MNTPDTSTTTHRTRFARWRRAGTTRRPALVRRIDLALHIVFAVVLGFVVIRSQGCAVPGRAIEPLKLHGPASQLNMDPSRNRVTYKGFRTGDAWEVVVERPGQSLRLLDRPRHPEQWPLAILTDYLGDPDRATELYSDFGALTVRRFTADWELSETEIDHALMELEILRARWRMAVMRG